MIKSFIIKICIVFFPIIISAQTTFSDPIIIQETLTDGAHSVYAADLDNDGDMDVLSTSIYDQKIAWYENTGNGTFGQQQVITSSLDYPIPVCAADLDNDGDMDVLSASVRDNKIVWYENTGGGIFESEQVITTSAVNVRSVFTADLDTDGDIDVLSASDGDNKIAWYENTGGGIFGPQMVITNSVDGAWLVFSEDLDNDGDMDVLSISSYDNKIAWYENTGGGTFGPQQIITISTYNTISVFTADLDNDGDMDVLAASTGIDWYENTGGGNFGPQQVITTSVDNTGCVYAADLDNDGDIDVLSASVYDNKIAWYENTGGDTFGPQQVITTSAKWAHSVYAADLDNDGDIDVLSASYGDNKIAWYENTEGGTFGPQQVITNSADGACSVHAADLDNDGNIDVLSASHGDNKIAWYENTEGGTFGPQQVITTSADGAVCVRAVDLDGDGDVDVLSASPFDNKIAWYENTNSGSFGPQQIITTSAFFPLSIYTADLDSDDDMDVLSASVYDNKIAWYENTGGGTFGPQQVITTSVYYANSVFAEDLDNDGDMDVLSTSSDDNKIAWYKNTGIGTFGPQQVITASAGGVMSIFATDLDNDGDMDVLAASAGIAWYENTGGGTFGPQQIINTSVYIARSVYAADLDNDGDMDVLAASAGIAWYENTENGTFGPQQVITTSANSAQCVYATDLDNDGDMDVLSVSSIDDKITWYCNQLSSPDDPTQILVPSEYATIQAAINAATDGDTILVDPGVYTINSSISNKSVNNLRILGSRDENGRNTSVIHVNSSPGTYACVRFENVSDCRISGFEMMHGSHGIVFDGCTNCKANRNFIHDIDATTDDGIGIAVWSSNQIQIDSCIIDNVDFRGITIWESSNILINHSTILNTRLQEGLSIAGTSDHITIKNTIFAYNQEEGIETTGLTFTDFIHDYNCFYQNNSGSISGHTIGSHSMESDPMLVDVPYRNYFLESSSPCLGTGEGGLNIGAMEEWIHTPMTLHVPSQYTSIHQALNTALYSDTIQVEAGIYNLASPISNIGLNNVHFEGARQKDGSDASIINGDSSPWTMPLFRFFNSVGCTISDFEIMNGSEGIVFDNCRDCESSNNYLHDNTIGIGIWNSENIKASYCIIDQSSIRGIGIWNTNDLDIDHNTILRSQSNEGLSIGGVSDHILIKNNIFAFNNEEGIDTQTITMIDFVHDYNCFWQDTSGSISGHTIGTNSFEADPMLVDMDNQNYYLQTGSPCLKTGEGGTYIGALGEVPGGTDVDDEISEIITEFTLHQNFPNPFNPNTIIPYSIPKASHVTLSIYNLRGERIAVLVNRHETPGQYQIAWEGKDAAGNSVASGIYLVRLEADSFVQTRKMLFVR